VTPARQMSRCRLHVHYRLRVSNYQPQTTFYIIEVQTSPVARAVDGHTFSQCHNHFRRCTRQLSSCCKSRDFKSYFVQTSDTPRFQKREAPFINRQLASL
jgi:hypothetical protein